MFRLNRVAFNDLLQKIGHLLPGQDIDEAVRSSGSPITNFCRLAMTLRWLAGGHYLDICQLYQVDYSTFYSEDGIIWPTIHAIHKVIKLAYPTTDPNDPDYNIEELQQVAEDFYTFSHGFFTSLAGAIDGLVVKTRAPYRSEAKNVVEYRNRKGCFGVLCLGISDIRGKFLYFACNWTGSTHDSFAWLSSSVYKKFREFKVRGYHLVGDEAFSNTNFLLSPWSGRGIGAWKDSFNYKLSSCRQCIERAFGMMVKRFGILQRRFMFHKRRWALVSVVCAKLHNICIDNNVPHLPRMYEDIGLDDNAEPLFNVTDDEDNVLVRPRARPDDIRSRLTKILEDKKLRRPQFANCNSRA